VLLNPGPSSSQKPDLGVWEYGSKDLGGYPLRGSGPRGSFGEGAPNRLSGTPHRVVSVARNEENALLDATDFVQRGLHKMGEDGGETLQEGAYFVQSDGKGTSQDEDPGKAAEEGKGGALAVHLGEGPREASWASRVRPRRRWGYGEKGLLNREGKAQTCRGRPPPGLDRASRRSREARALGVLPPGRS